MGGYSDEKYLVMDGPEFRRAVLDGEGAIRQVCLPFSALNKVFLRHHFAVKCIASSDLLSATRLRSRAQVDAQ